MFLSKFRKWKADKEDHEVVKIVDYETGLEIFYLLPDEQDVEVEGGEQEKGERDEVQEDEPTEDKDKDVGKDADEDQYEYKDEEEGEGENGDGDKASLPDTTLHLGQLILWSQAQATLVRQFGKQYLHWYWCMGGHTICKAIFIPLLVQENFQRYVLLLRTFFSLNHTLLDTSVQN